jgi:hypothetical protein
MDAHHLVRALTVPRTPCLDLDARARERWIALLDTALTQPADLDERACRKCSGRARRHHRACWLRGAGTRARQRALARRLSGAREQLEHAELFDTDEVARAARWFAFTYRLGSAAQVAAVIERMTGRLGVRYLLHPRPAQIEIQMPTGTILVRLATEGETLEARTGLRRDPPGLPAWALPTSPVLVLVEGALPGLDPTTATVATFEETIGYLQSVADSIAASLRARFDKSA